MGLLGPNPVLDGRKFPMTNVNSVFKVFKVCKYYQKTVILAKSFLDVYSI